MEDVLASNRPKVGVTVLVLKDGKILLGKRLGPVPASGMYQTPGGHVEHLESFVECAKRELREEVSIEIANVTFVCVKNVLEFAPVHYVIIGLYADWESGELKNCERDKCEGWDWYSLDQLPSPLTPATEAVIQGYLKSKRFFD